MDEEKEVEDGDEVKLKQYIPVEEEEEDNIADDMDIKIDEEEV